MTKFVNTGPGIFRVNSAKGLCPQGIHEIKPGSFGKRSDGSIRCNACRNEARRAFRASLSEKELERRRAAARMRKREARAKARGEYDLEDPLALKDDNRPMAPWNLLKPKDRAMPAWTRFQERMAEERTACFKNPELFTDYDDPRYKDENTGRPMPTRSQARRMCADCPLFSECDEYRKAQNEDWGTWAGVVMVGGKDWWA